MELPLAMFSPLFDIYPRTAISVPAARAFLVMPTRSKLLGVLPSIAQLVYGAIGILHRDMDEGVRVDPLHLSNGPLQDDDFVLVELGGKGVVGENRGRGQDRAGHRERKLTWHPNHLRGAVD